MDLMLESVGTNYNELTFYKLSPDIEVGNELMRDPHLWQKCYLTHGVVEAANFKLADLQRDKRYSLHCKKCLFNKAAQLDNNKQKFSFSFFLSTFPHSNISYKKT